jgi:hypothetical protein
MLIRISRAGDLALNLLRRLLQQGISMWSALPPWQPDQVAPPGRVGGCALLPLQTARFQLTCQYYNLLPLCAPVVHIPVPSISLFLYFLSKRFPARPILPALPALGFSLSPGANASDSFCFKWFHPSPLPRATTSEVLAEALLHYTNSKPIAAPHYMTFSGRRVAVGTHRKTCNMVIDGFLRSC